MNVQIRKSLQVMMRWLVMTVFCMPLLSWAGPPTDALKGTIDQVMQVLSVEDLDNEIKKRQIREVISIRFDYRAMSQRTLARNWKKASEGQQKHFVELYGTMLQNTYLVLVEEYTDQKVSYGAEKLRKGKYAQVNTIIHDQGKEIPVNYKLRLKDGDWFVYDVIIEGVSMINNYRTSYQSIVKNHGMDGLLTKLEAKLHEVEAKSSK